MNPVICALYDKKAQVFLPAVVYADLATAERAYIAFLAEGKSTPAQWPDDFDLYHLGNQDCRTGALVSLERPAVVITGQSAFYNLTELRRRYAAGGELSGGGNPPEDKVAARPDGVSSATVGVASQDSSDSASGSVRTASAAGA